MITKPLTVPSPPTLLRTTRNREPRQVRSLFLSDCHLGSIHAHAEELLAFLSSHHAENIYLVGDIVDGWALRKRWRWSRANSLILHHLFDAATQGTNLFYAPGNHDEFLRDFLRDFGFVRIAQEFRHHTPDGRSMLVVHGDLFDEHIALPGWLKTVGSLGYDVLFALNAKLNAARRALGFPRSRFGLDVRDRLGLADNFLRQWREIALQHAARAHCDGIICGHVHTPTQSVVNDLLYLNIGDWMESCVALVEDFDGTFRHVKYAPTSLHPSPRSDHANVDAQAPLLAHGH